MKRFQKAMVSCALALTLIAPARGAVGIGFAAPLAVVAGAATMAVAGGGIYAGVRMVKNGKPVLGIGLGLLSAVAGSYGFVLLDGEHEAKFAELNAEGAKDLGISQAEMDIYNSELEQVNAIAREIGSELLAQNSESVEVSRDLWIELGSALSPETLKTVSLIAQQQ